MIARALIVGCTDDEAHIVRAVLRDAVSGIHVSEAIDALTFATALAGFDPQLVIVARACEWTDGLAIVRHVCRRLPDCITILLGETDSDLEDPEAQPDAHLSRAPSGLARIGRAAVRAAERRARLTRNAPGADALDALPVAVLQLAPDERVIAANAAAVTLLGQTQEAALAGKLLAEVVREAEAPPSRHQSQTLATIASATPSGLPVLVERGVGAPVRCRLVVRTRACAGALVGFVATLLPRAGDSRDGTGKLLYSISHDLQQPLSTIVTSVRTLSERLESDRRLDAEEERMLRRIRSGTSRMEDMVSGLLEYVRTGRDAPAIGPFELERVVEDVVQGLQTQIDRSGGRVRWSDLPRIEANRADITRLVENLVSNALKFYADTPPVVDIDCVDRGDAWLLSVRDNGIGVDPKQTDHIFEPFQRLHSASEYPGTGIGLAICRQICERHGGRIWVTANPDHGSTFFATVAKPAG